MYCQYCKTKLEDDAKVCSFCGNPVTRIGAKELDEEETNRQIQDFSRTMAAFGMADRYHVSSVILCVFGAICAFFAVLMFLAINNAGKVNGFTEDKSYYAMMALLHGITAVSGFAWALVQRMEKNRILRENKYSAQGVIATTAAFCALLLARALISLRVKSASDIFFLFLVAIVLMYEIFWVILYAKKGGEDV